MAGDDQDLRRLPSVERVAADSRLAGLEIAPAFLRNAVRQRIDSERSLIRAGEESATGDVTERIVSELLGLFRPATIPVINATGVLIHTNLGRVPVSRATAEAMAAASSSMVTLEVDPTTGRRGDRQCRVSALLRALTGCEAALVVNNNAAAMLLTVAALSAGRDTIVSRGEAVEIGGGFRIPDVLRQGGARLVEVGTTNRTYVSDYRDACTDATGILLKVHPSNFVISGYTYETTVRELAGIGRAHGVPVVEDQGSGLLNRVELAGVELGRSLADSLADGTDIVTASGDKLLGGPQCGLILGRADLVSRIAGHPIARAVRVDKVTLAGLEVTLLHFLRGEEASEVPVWRMATMPVENLRRRAETVVVGLPDEDEWLAEVISSTATFGGGALPGQELPSVAIRIRPVDGRGVERLVRRLRTGEPAVWGRVEDGALRLDLRSVLPEEDGEVGRALGTALNGMPRKR